MKRPCGEDTEGKFDVDQQPALPQKLTLWQLYGLGVFSKPRSEGLLEAQRSGMICGAETDGFPGSLLKILWLV
jgi:hypothetical protein